MNQEKRYLTAETYSMRSGVCLAGMAEIMAAGAKPLDAFVGAGFTIGSSVNECNKFGANNVAKFVASILFPGSGVPTKTSEC